MPKIKTRKSISKRIRVTRHKKIMKRKCGQDHFNARESGNTTRNKRRNMILPKTKAHKNIQLEIPYSF